MDLLSNNLTGFLCETLNTAFFIKYVMYVRILFTLIHFKDHLFSGQINFYSYLLSTFDTFR